jgi:60 kDa SS-A/Ro ribonucleoprotein
VTGHRGRGTSKIRCVDVAALFASAILRRNPDSVVIPFDQQAFDVKLDASDAILSLAKRLAAYGGGGTDCSLPIKRVNDFKKKRAFAGIVLVSDNESWIQQGRAFGFGQDKATGVMAEWTKFVQDQVRLQGSGFSGPKLVCIDLQPNTTTQAPDRSDIMNIGGFSDAVFEVVAAFLASDSNRFVSEVEAMTL